MGKLLLCEIQRLPKVWMTKLLMKLWLLKSINVVSYTAAEKGDYIIWMHLMCVFHVISLVSSISGRGGA